VIEQRELLHFAAWHARCEIVRHAAVESCIASTRIVTSLFHEMGIPSQPIVVGAIAMNKTAWEKHQRGEQPHLGDGSFAVRIQHEYEDDPSKWAGHPGPWPGGHIVLAAAGKYLVDPSADQMSFPDEGLTMEPLVIDLGENYEAFILGEGQPQISTEEGAVLAYQAFPDDLSYRHSSDWNEIVPGEPLFDRVRDQVLGLVEMAQDAGQLPARLPDLPQSLRTKDVGSPEFAEMLERSLRELGPRDGGQKFQEPGTPTPRVEDLFR
jgi:hypothetical protein